MNTNNKKISFAPPYVDNDVLSEVADSLKSGWITTGPKVKSLEGEVSKLGSIPYSVCVNSATSGLIMAMRWFGIGSGDEVIVPSYTYCATALAVMHLGATPIMVDTQNDFTINTDKIEAKITSRTKAIIPVDIAGWPADYDSITRIVKEPKIVQLFIAETEVQKSLGRILILSDAAHSLGAIYKGKPVGSVCDLTVFSFHAVKNITTAEGGAVCLNLPEPFINSEVYSTLRLMSLNGQTKDAFTKSSVGGWKYDIVLFGFKMNMPDICAAIGLAQIRKYKSFILPRRKELALKYSKLFCKFGWAVLPPLIDNDGSESSYHIYLLRIAGITESQRDKIIEKISETGVAVNVHFIPMPMLSLFKTMGYDIREHPISYGNYSCEISLPIYPQLNYSDIEYIASSVVNAYRNVTGNK